MLFMGKLVPEEGFEPTWNAMSRWILSPVRLPISPLRHSGAPKIISHPPEVNKLVAVDSKHLCFRNNFKNSQVS